MSASVLQQPSVKQRLAPMESVNEVQLPVFAGTHTSPSFSCRTQSHYSTSPPQGSSPKHKKRSIIRRYPSVSKPTSQKSTSQASKEGQPISSPTLPAGARSATSSSSSRDSTSSPRPSKGQAKGSTNQQIEKKKKHSHGPPPRFIADRRQTSKAKRETSLTSHTIGSKKESGQQEEMVKVRPVARDVVADTTQHRLEEQQDNLSIDVHTEEGEGLPTESSTPNQDQQESPAGSLTSGSESRLTLDLDSLISIKVSTQRRSSIAGSDVEEELFQDALSYLPNRIKSGLSSTRSSAFVTPASTRSQSPVNLTPHQSDSLETTQSFDLVQESLEQLKIEQELNLFNKSNVVSPEDSPSCGSHVTLIDDNESDSTPNCPYTFIHSSQIHKETKSQSLSSSSSITTPHCTSDTVFVGDIEVKVNTQKDEKLGFELPPSPVQFIDEERDSGCSMSIGSPTKASLKIKAKRPGLIYVPKGMLSKAQPGSFEFSSLSTASPQSSISSSSPLSLSPSPTPPLPSQGSHTDSVAEPIQEWPDFGFRPSHSGASVCVSHPHPNGTVRQAPLGEYHHPTPEDMLRMDQWRTNLLAQLRQQQEKLDQKKKLQREHESSFCECDSLPTSHRYGSPPLHGSLPPLPQNGVLPPPLAPLPPRRSLPPLPQNGVLPPPLAPLPPHSSLPPRPLIPPLPPHVSMPGYLGSPHMLFPPPPPPHNPHVGPQHPAQRFSIPPPPHIPTQPLETRGNSPPPSSWSSGDRPQEDSQPQTTTPPPTKSPTHPPPNSHTHPLCNKWVLWFDKISMGSHKNSCSVSDYKDSLQKIYTVSSVEHFWRVFNNIKPPSMLEIGTNYHFFRKGIQPLWEDPANKKGGKWVLSVKDFVSPHVLDRAWLEVLLMLIGGCAMKRNIVNGVVVSRRGKRGNKIAIWTSQTETAATLEICKELIKALVLACGVQKNQLPTFVKHLSECKNGIGLVFMHNTDSLKSMSSYQNESHIKLKDHVQDLLHDLGCR